MTNFFNKIVKNQKENRQEEIKKEISHYAQEILDMFKLRNLKVGMMNDILQTAQNYINVLSLRQDMKDLLKAELPEKPEEIKND